MGTATMKTIRCCPIIFAALCMTYAFSTESGSSAEEQWLPHDGDNTKDVQELPNFENRRSMQQTRRAFYVKDLMESQKSRNRWPDEEFRVQALTKLLMQQDRNKELTKLLMKTKQHEIKELRAENLKLKRLLMRQGSSKELERMQTK